MALADSKICAFLTVVDEGGFTAAARRLGITQPAVSAQIASLESSLGFPLFQRGRELSLTPEGESFLPYARRIQAAYDLANDTFSNVFSK
jgi:DNA-binding transcriptional LysR family regulator